MKAVDKLKKKSLTTRSYVEEALLNGRMYNIFT